MKGGDNPQEVSRLFSRSITGWFEENPGLSIESTGEYLAVYYFDRRLKSQEIPVFLQLAKTVSELFSKNGLSMDTRRQLVLGPGIKARKFNLRHVMFTIILVGVATISTAKFIDFELRPFSPPKPPIKVAHQAYNDGDFQTAADAYTEHLKAHAGDEKSHYFRALALAKLGRTDQALTGLKEAVRLNPGFYNAYLYLDYLLAQESRFAEVIDYWGVYLAQVPGDGRAYLERGGAHKHSGNSEQAFKDVGIACDLGIETACQIVGK